MPGWPEYAKLGLAAQQRVRIHVPQMWKWAYVQLCEGHLYIELSKLG